VIIMAAEILLLNPRRRRKNPSGKRRATAKQIAWRKTFAARYGGKSKRRASSRVAANPSRRRRNPMKSVTYKGRPVSARRWRASGYRRNPVGRRRYRRNPIGGGGGSSIRANVNSITKLIGESAQGAAGAVAVDITMGFVAPMLPTVMLGQWTYPATKMAVAIGLGIAAQSVLPSGLRRFAAEGVKGSLTCTLHQVLTPMIAGILPLGGRVGGRGMGYVSSAYIPARQQMKGLGEHLSEHTPMQREMYDTGPAYQTMGEFLNR
jgi:hypothetical protein